jgi:hypothetical protein
VPLVALLALVNAPIAVATVRALARGWLPVGDNGILLVRARDVGTSHHPLLGSWTSASMVVGEQVNNPGPLYFDALAPTVRLLGPWVGLAVGVMLVNMAAASLAVVAARRISGAGSMVAVGLVLIGLQYAMGSELLFDVWQPNALLLPCLAFLVVATVLAAGDVTMAPWVVGVGSLLVQTHMSYGVVVAAAGIAALGAVAWHWRRATRSMAETGGVTESRRWRRPAAWSALVLVLAWCQPVVEQLTGEGEGNLSRIVDASRGGDAITVGWSRALRLIAEIIVGGPWVTRTGFDHAVPRVAPDAPLPGIASLFTAVVVLGAIGAALLVGGVWAARRGRHGVAVMNGMAGVALVAAYLALATAPVNAIGLAVHQMRWVWPVGAFVTAAWLTTLASLLRDDVLRRRVLAVGVVAVAVVAAVTLPTHASQAPGPLDDIDAMGRGRDLVAQLGSLEGRGTILYDPTVLVFAEPYSGLVFAEMQDRGIPFVFDDEVFIRQFGQSRRNDGTPELRMWEAVGASAATVPQGAERVAYVAAGSQSVALFVEPLP